MSWRTPSSTVNAQDILQVRTLQANRDWTGLGVLAHRIKGAAQMTGDAQLSAPLRCGRTAMR